MPRRVNSISNDDLRSHVMQTRITYRQQKAAQAALQELMGAQRDARSKYKTKHEDPLLTFAELCWVRKGW